MNHPLADPAHLIPLGNQVERLKAEINRVLDAPADHPRPATVTTYAQQAAAFHQLAQSLIA